MPLALCFLSICQALLLDLHLQCHSHHLFWLPGRSPCPLWPQLPGQCWQPPMASQIMGMPSFEGQAAEKGTCGCHQRCLWGKAQALGNGAEQDRALIGGTEDAGGGGCPRMGPHCCPPLLCSATRHVWPSTAACATRASPTGSPSPCSPCSFACSSTPSLVTQHQTLHSSLPRGSLLPLAHPSCSELLCPAHYTATHPHLPVSRALWLPDLWQGRGIRRPDVLPRE